MKKWFLPLVLVLGLSFLLSACTPTTQAPSTSAPAPATTQPASSAPPKPAASPTQTPATTAPAAALTPIRGGIMKFVTVRAPVVLGYPPRIAGNDTHWARPFIEGLLYQDNNGAYQPSLATSYDIAPDGKSVTFKLRQGVQFNDGTPFNAAAVKWNFDQLIPPKGNILAWVSSIDVIDDYTVKLNLPAYNNLLVYSLAVDIRTCIVSPTAVQKNGVDWAALHPTGTGPYLLKSYEPNTSVTYEKNPNYWNKGLPYLDGIKGSAVADPMTQVASVKSGDASYVWDAAPATAVQLRDAGYKLQMVPATLQSLIGDTAKPDSIWADQRLREAMEYAIDKEAICSGPGMGLYQPMYQIAMTGSPNYNPALTPRKYDVAKAKQLLAAAGKPDGFEFTFFLNQTEWRDGFVAIQDYLSKVGIKMNIQLITQAVYQDYRLTGKIDKNGSTLMIMEMRPNNLLSYDTFLKSDSIYYGFLAKPKAVDSVIVQTEAARDDAAMTSGMQQIAKVIYDNEPFVPLWSQPRILVTDKIVQDPGYFYNGDALNSRLGYTSWLNTK